MNRSGLRKPFPYTNIKLTYILIGINAVIFLFTSLFSSLKVYLSINPVTFIHYKFFWTLITYMFVHANFTHLLFNMLGLFFFGPPLEARMGSWEFLTYYLTSGFLSGVFSLGVYTFFGQSRTLLMGASGAIYSILLAFAVFYPRARIFFMGFIPIKAPVMVALYAGLELFQQVFRSNSGVAHLTHLAGLGFGFLYFLIRLGVNPIKVFMESRRVERWNPRDRQ